MARPLMRTIPWKQALRVVVQPVSGETLHAALLLLVTIRTRIYIVASNEGALEDPLLETAMKWFVSKELIENKNGRNHSNEILYHEKAQDLSHPSARLQPIMQSHPPCFSNAFSKC